MTHEDMPAQAGPGTLANPFREALKAGRPLVGVWAMLNSANAVEGVGWAGYDWMLVDGEHAPVSVGEALGHLRTLAGTPTLPIVRLPWNDPVLLKQFLDIGTQTVMLPYVQSAEEARQAVAAMHYPPRGTRGVAVMHRGRLVELGSAEQICTAPEEDYTRSLISAVPNPDPRNKCMLHRTRFTA